MLSYDVVIIGAGGAGMMAALSASEDKSLRVACLSKIFPTRSHTGAAQGGINAAMGYRDANDSPESHFRDTVKGSDFLADQDAVEFLLQICQRSFLNSIITEFLFQEMRMAGLPRDHLAVPPAQGLAIQPIKLGMLSCMPFMNNA